VLAGEGLSKASWAEMRKAQVQVPKNCVVCPGRAEEGLSQALGWGLGWAVEQAGDKRLIFHWGENNGDVQAFVIGDPARRSGLVMLTNSGNGLSIAPALSARVFPGEHPAFQWMGYDAYDSPARTVQRRIVREGAGPALAEAAGGRVVLTEPQWNRIGYHLLARGRTADAIAVLEANARAFPTSANTHDSLGEAYLAAGRKAEALASYRRSLALDLKNENARQVIARLEAGEPR
jgi:tetratricopeptide (TPR) repeat protein